MLSELIFFNNIDIYNRCVHEATRVSLTTNKFIISCCINYFKKFDDKKSIKKPLHLWILLEEDAQKHKLTVAELIEKVCGEAIGAVPVLKPDVAEGKKGVFQKIANFTDLNRGVVKESV